MTYDQFMEALCLWREARGASMPAKQGVLSVIRNRVADKRFPNTSAGVIVQPWQFSSFNDSDPNSKRWPLPGPEWQAWLDCLAVVNAPLGGDPTDGATNYESLPDGMAKPKWADEAKFTCKIGPFSFYRL